MRVLCTKTGGSGVLGEVVEEEDEGRGPWEVT